tara:strand:- start:1054 stop:2058 length:1005 start_codon:yes stop_codon:yes gene_type:complete
MEILKSKDILVSEINTLFTKFQDHEKIILSEKEKYNDEINRHIEVNKKLMDEIKQKDKLLIVNEKKMVDYEEMINKIQNDAMKEIDEKTKHDMLRAQDKEIHSRDIEIKRLQKKLETLDKKEHSKSWMDLEHNSYHNDNEKVTIAIEAYSKHLGGVDNGTITIRDVAITSAGINGWYKDGLIHVRKKGTLVDKMKNITKHQDNFENVKEIVKEEEQGGDNNKKDDNGVIEETEVVENDDNKKDDNGVIEETEVVDDDNETGDNGVIEETEVVDDDDETDESEEEIEVEMITHYKKQYYIIKGEKEQYIYAINDGGLGDKVGEIKDGKKVMYKKN